MNFNRGVIQVKCSVEFTSRNTVVRDKSGHISSQTSFLTRFS